MLLAFPPFNLAPLVFVAMAPWLFSLRDTNGKEAWRKGYGFGFLYGLGQVFWIAQLVGHWVGSLALGLVPWIGASAIFALYFGWAGVLISKAWARNWLWAIPLAWGGIEAIRSHLPIVAFPWGLAATPLWRFPELIQTAHFGTIYMVSAWVLTANLILVLLIVKTPYKTLRPIVSVFLALATMSFLAMGVGGPYENVPVTIGQPGVDMAFGDPSAEDSALYAKITPIAKKAKADGSHLLVLPEGIATALVMPPEPPFKMVPGLPVLFGGRRGSSPAFQSAFSFDGKAWHYADKTRLMIFGEFVPGREIFPALAQAFKLPGGDLSAGQNGVQALSVGEFKAGPVICFEALFPDVAYHQARNGARLLAVISNDDWFMDGNTPSQLKVAAIWRSVETGLPTVRAASLGYSLACDAHGRLLATIPLRASAGLTLPVPLPTKPTLFIPIVVFPVGAAFFALYLTLPLRQGIRRTMKS